MIIADLPTAELRNRLHRGELLLDIHPFVARLRSDIPSISEDMALMYGDFEVLESEAFADFHVEVSRDRGLRRWVRPHARFYFDGRPSFIPLPIHQAFAMLEWGLNWCVAAHSHQFLIVHAAVVERDGLAALLPAPPGSGKSTLCSGLIQKGWRLLSDELGLYDMETGLIHGMARPVNLKNASIDVIRRFAPDAVMTRPMPDTTKGTVCLMRPPKESVARRREPAKPVWIVLPRYLRDAPPNMLPYDPAHAFMLLAEQSFNYDIHGATGFDAIGDLVDRCRCLEFAYGNLDDAEPAFRRLLEEL